MMGVQKRTLYEVNLSGLAQSIAQYETSKSSFHRVDGLIIGTGRADFTQGNVPYTLEYQGKTFELIDVPGIEGDESKFTGLVQEAVARAHLVFYVNGTNKKPEKATAEKIRSYLRRGSNVCPLVNVRGSADAYEFEEDRESLHQSGAGDILNQTEAVLSSVLGENVLMPGHCVQGLMGFTSLAFDQVSATTSIHPSRESDLVRHQRNYLKYFDNPGAMYEFCKMDAVAAVLKGKLSTFREDIVESNKAKVQELLNRNLEVLTEIVESHRSFLDQVAPEFEKCRTAINEALISFERLSVSSRCNIYNELFNSLVEDSDNIVEENFGEAADIKRGIESAFDRHSQSAESKLEKDLDLNLQTLVDQLEKSMARLLEDVERVQFGQQFRVDNASGWSFQQAGDLGWNLGLGDFGSIAFQIGSYGLAGAGIGSAFPGIGTAIGAAVGVAVGAIMAVLNLFMGKARRIRKSQAKVREKIEDVRDKKLSKVNSEVSKLMSSVRKGVDEAVIKKVHDLEVSLAVPVDVIEKQISMLSNLKNRIERMPYGSTTAV
ncbi:P-loop NTPase family protein [Zobellella denitrificans]